MVQLNIAHYPRLGRGVAQALSLRFIRLQWFWDGKTRNIYEKYIDSSCKIAYYP